MCDTKLAYICTMCVWNLCMCRWSCIPWVSGGRYILTCAWYGFFLSACYQHCFILFLYHVSIISLFHLEGYRIRLNNRPRPVSGMLRHFESRQCSIFRGLKAIFYDIEAHVAQSDMIIPGPGQACACCGAGRRGCVSCCAHATSERGLSYTPRFGARGAMLVLPV